MYINDEIYIDDVKNVANVDLSWDQLKNKSVLLTGASGMLGTFLVDVLMYKNHTENLNIKIYAAGRSVDKARERFNDYWRDNNFNFVTMEVNNPIDIDIQADYIIHAASNTHPKLYATDPVGSLMTNILGTYNLLEYARHNKTERVIFLSTVEIYGEARNANDIFDESYLGYIDCNTTRAGYPEGKRAGESLCNAYISKYGMDIVIPRLSRSYGPTMRLDDSKAMSQFIMNGVRREDIILKSKGTQRFSYCYSADAVLGIFYTWLKGECGNAYNVAGTDEVISLKDITQIIAEFVGKKVIFNLPNEVENAGFSKVSTCIMDTQKLQKLGWQPFDTIQSGLKKTIEILRHK